MAVFGQGLVASEDSRYTERWGFLEFRRAGIAIDVPRQADDIES
jgi:hypothetical protein